MGFSFANSKYFALFAMLLVLAGCSSTPRRFYPIGIYSVPRQNLDDVCRAGFNAVAGSAERDYLDRAHQLGLKVMAAPGTAAGPRFDPARARQTVAAFDRHPALWAWYLADEPDLVRISPEQIRSAHRTLKMAGARKPDAIVLYDGTDALDYANIADITMIDRYPIPWLPLANFPEHVRMTRLALGKQKPLIAVIQAFDWSYFPELLPGEKNLRPPNYAELRCMAYCALVRQANGIFFYGYDDGRWKITSHPETWEALQKLIAEIRERLPLFQATPVWWPYRHDYRDPSRRFNAALTSSISPALVRVPHGDATVASGEYIVAANTTPWTQGYSVRLPYPVEGQIPVLGENRSARLTKNRRIEDDFQPYAVHVYGPLHRAKKSSKI